MMDILGVEQAERANVIAAVRADMAIVMAANAETSPQTYYNAVVANI